MRVLVCGGRDFDDAGLMISVLDRLHTEKFFTVLIHGNARGADRIADAWASCRGIPREPYEVPQGEWDEIGKKAAPLRNQRMLDEGKPDLVVAFPGGGGTKDIVRRAWSVEHSITLAARSTLCEAQEPLQSRRPQVSCRSKPYSSKCD